MKWDVNPRIVVYVIISVCIVSLVMQSMCISLSTEYKPVGYTPRLTCSSNHTAHIDIIIYIPTPIAWAARRRLVLNQFLRESHARVHLLFFFGTKQGPNLELEVDNIASARREAMQHKALHPRVQYIFTECRDYGDEENNPNGTSSTTCKVYEALRYIAHAYKDSPPRYIWRGADDSYLDIQLFRDHVMPFIQSCRLFLGRLRFPRPDGSSDLELLPDQPNLYTLYGLKKFGKYMLGMGFCMSWDVVHFIGTAPIPPRLTWCEDVIVSHWLLFYDVDFVDVRSVDSKVLMFQAGGDKYDAFYHVLLAHQMSDSQWVALARRPFGSHSSSYLK